MPKYISSFSLFYILAIISFEALSQDLPHKREFRGVWVATVANIDWPSKPGLNSEIQKSEFIKLLDSHKQSGINAVMFQIRPTTDAFYSRGREMWSKWLTGRQGVAPAPFYDPLDFAITEAHKRGMELHAWFNPYRAAFSLLPTETNANHITRKNPSWFINYGGKKLFNPGLPEVRSYIVQVVMDVVQNYDIDGVHFDDYFYPYLISGRPFPDTESYIRYGKNYKNIQEWRRSNVDSLISTLNDSIHKAKSYLKFGISPFGIWNNKKDHPEGSITNGGSSYTELYADTRKWLQEGWIDYVNPQIYWPFEHRLAPFENLLDWWSNNTFGRHLYIGQAAFRANENVQGFRNRAELPNQIRALRANSRVQGSVFFSSKSLTDNLAGFRDSLRADLYSLPALPPQMLWIDPIVPQAPLQLSSYVKEDNSIQLKWYEPLRARDGETAYGFVIYKFKQGEELNIQDPSKIISISFDSKITSFEDKLTSKGSQYVYLVTAIDRIKNESLPSNSTMVYIP